MCFGAPFDQAGTAARYVFRNFPVRHLNGFGFTLIGEGLGTGSLVMRPVAVVDFQIENVVGDKKNEHNTNTSNSTGELKVSNRLSGTSSAKRKRAQHKHAQFFS